VTSSIPKALILDRDGTLITHVPYLSDPSLVALLPGVRDGLHRALNAGIKLFLHSNQSGVGRGFFPLEAVHACNNRMIELLDLGSPPFTRICFAPEAPEQPTCYRKPSPRFAKEVMHEFGLEADELCYIGDRGSDLETAKAAGTRGIGVSTGLDDLLAEMTRAGINGTYPVFHRFDEAINYLLAIK
jgi:D-glycero-D-manno-heptose 1,7-bisphosphate phosphatase